jgi:hypothetical protein
MPDVEEKKTVDIDTSGPGAEIELQQEEKENESLEVSNDTENNNTVESTESIESSDEKSEVKAEESEENKTDSEKDKDLDEYSKSVRKRIEKLTGKWREAERQKDEALTYAQKMILAKKRAEDRIQKLEPGYLKSTEDSITAGLQAAKAQLAAARESQDLAAESEALTLISELGYKRARFAEAKEAQAEYNKRQESLRSSDINLQRQATPQQATPDPKAEDWASKNSWFGQDSAMTYTAFDLHKKLTEEEGYDPESDEYYSEIDKRIRLEFPHKFAKKEPKETTKPVQTVASAKRSTKTGRKTVTLTPSQVAIAKKLGVPLEEYAKHLNTKEV